MAPKGDHVLIPGPCEYVTLPGKGTLQMGLSEDSCREEIPLDSLGEHSALTRVPGRGRPEGQNQRSRVRMEVEVGVMQP